MVTELCGTVMVNESRMANKQVLTEWKKGRVMSYQLVILVDQLVFNWLFSQCSFNHIWHCFLWLWYTCQFTTNTMFCFYRPSNRSEDWHLCDQFWSSVWHRHGKSLYLTVPHKASSSGISRQYATCERKMQCLQKPRLYTSNMNCFWKDKLLVKWLFDTL